MGKQTRTAGTQIDPSALILDGATVEDDAIIKGGVILKNKATVGDRSFVAAARAGGVIIGGNAVVGGMARVQGSTSGVVSIGGNAKVIGKSRIKNAVQPGKPFSVSGNATVSGEAELGGTAYVGGNAKVYGKCFIRDDAMVLGDAKVYGTAVISGNATVMGRADISGTATLLGGVWDGSEGKITSGRWLGPDLPDGPQVDSYRQQKTRSLPEYMTQDEAANADAAANRFLRQASGKPKVRANLLRMAKERPELRAAILTFLNKKAGDEDVTADEMFAGRKWDGGRQKPDDSVPYNLHPDSPPAGSDGSEARKKYNQWYRKNVCPDHKTNCGL
jgi:carbonic anhydrase/acetyltransferase-like protein (isoleucine patch superfamily)